jgi:hypothetical protein
LGNEGTERHGDGEKQRRGEKGIEKDKRRNKIVATDNRHGFTRIKEETRGKGEKKGKKLK